MVINKNFELISRGTSCGVQHVGTILKSSLRVGQSEGNFENCTNLPSGPRNPGIGYLSDAYLSLATVVRKIQKLESLCWKISLGSWSVVHRDTNLEVFLTTLRIFLTEFLYFKHKTFHLVEFRTTFPTSIKIEKSALIPNAISRCNF